MRELTLIETEEVDGGIALAIGIGLLLVGAVVVGFLHAHEDCDT